MIKDAEKMNEKQLEKAKERIAKKITKINDVACEKANKLLEEYGLQAKMQILIEKKQ